MKGDFISRTDIEKIEHGIRYRAHTCLTDERAKEREVMQKYGLKNRKQLKKMIKKARRMKRAEENAIEENKEWPNTQMCEVCSMYQPHIDDTDPSGELKRCRNTCLKWLCNDGACPCRKVVV
jgi:hypothetical protein